MQNCDKVVASRFLTRGTGHLQQRIVDINGFFFDKRQPLRVRIHKSKGICVQLIVR